MLSTNNNINPINNKINPKYLETLFEFLNLESFEDSTYL